MTGMSFMEVMMPFTEDVDFSGTGLCRLKGGGGGWGCPYFPDNHVAKSDGRTGAQFERSGAFQVQVRWSRQVRHLWELPLVSTLPSIIFFKKPPSETFIFFLSAQCYSVFGVVSFEGGPLQQGLGCIPGCFVNVTSCRPQYRAEQPCFTASLTQLSFFFFSSHNNDGNH